MSKKSISWLKQLCSLGMQGQKLMPIISSELITIIPARSVTWCLLDPLGNTSNLYDELAYSLPDNERVLKSLLLQTYRVPWLDLLQWLKVQDMLDTSRSSSAAACYQSFNKDQFLRKLGYDKGLIAAIRYRGTLTGLILFHRSSSDPKFTAKERKKLTKILPMIAQLSVCDEKDTVGLNMLGSPGSILIDNKHELISMCAKARLLWLMINLPIVNLDSLRQAQGGVIVNENIGRQLTLLRQPEMHTAAGKQRRWKHTNGWGSFILNVSVMQSYHCELAHEVYLVTLQLVHPIAMSLVNKRDRLPLTPKQLEICIPLLAGCTYDAIAVQQHISKHTVISHVKSIFSKLDVRNRTELINALISA